MHSISITQRVATGICGTALALLAAGCLEQSDVGAVGSPPDDVDEDGLAVMAPELESETVPLAAYYNVKLFNENSDPNSKMCAAIGGGSTAPAARAIQWHCRTGGEEQRWDLHLLHDGWKIVNRNSGFCLAIGGGSTLPGRDVIQWPCEDRGEHREQRWLRHIHGAYDQFQNLNSGLCLSVASGSRAAGARLIQWDCSPIRPGQLWDCLTSFGTRCHNGPPA